MPIVAATRFYDLQLIKDLNYQIVLVNLFRYNNFTEKVERREKQKIMKIILDIKDEKAAFMLELLKNFKFVTAKPISPYKAEILEGLKDAVDQVNKAKNGEIKLKPASQLFDDI